MEVVVLEGQSMFDIAIQTSGSVETAVALAVANNTSITGQLQASETLTRAPVENKQIVDYYTSRNITPATLVTDRGVTRKRGIGNMTIGQDFKVG